MKLAAKRLITIMLLIITVLSSWAGNTTMPGLSFAPELPSYVLVLDDDYEMDRYHVPDTLFNSIAGHTIFKVNRTELDPQDDFLHELTEKVLPIANQKEWMLVGIDLRGAASPEGPYDNNVRLSRGRTHSLIRLMSTRLDSVQVNEATITSVAEDYAYLQWLMDQANDPDAPTVREIITKHTLDNPKAIKTALQRHESGRLWHRLNQEYFPTLRSARVVLFFRHIYPKKHEVHFDTPIEPIDVPSPDLSGVEPEWIDSPLPEYRPERQHALSVGTNLLYDVFYMPQYGWAPMPNVQLEYYPKHGNFTFQIAFLTPYYHRWSRQQFFQIRDYHIEARRYFNPGKRHTGLYLGLYANANIYGIGLSAKKGWEGEGYGGALKLGYVVPLGSGRWRMDLHIAAGGYVTRYDPYVYGNPITGGIDGDYYYDYTGSKDDFVERNHRFSWLGPTEIGCTITYDLLFY